MSASAASARARIEHLLGIDHETKPEFYLRMFHSSELSVNFTLEILLSAGIATMGLVLDSPAVVIGAMLISPLMGPILAAGLALAVADLYLGIKSLLSILFGVGCAILFAGTLVWFLPFQSITNELLARTKPNLLDLGVALLSGLAGGLVVCRGGSGGGVTALPGVAIAVALMPPLCTVGFGVGSGFSRPVMSGAGLLFLTNLAAIVASAFVVFHLARMDAPDVRAKIDRAILDHASRDRLYRVLHRTRLSKAFGDIGKLRWRIVMLVAVLAVLFVPLRQSLMQVRDEAVARAAVGEALRVLLPSSGAVTQNIDLNSNPIALRLVITGTIPPERVERAERIILQRTGRDVSINIRKVAAEEELASLRAAIAAPAPPPPPPQKTLDELRAELLPKLDAPLKELWPSEAGQVITYHLGFAPERVVVQVHYQSPRRLDGAAEEVLRNALRSRLGVQDLMLVLSREAAPVRRAGVVR